MAFTGLRASSAALSPMSAEVCEAAVTLDTESLPRAIIAAARAPSTATETSHARSAGNMMIDMHALASDEARKTHEIRVCHIPAI